jgi:hypothetical protein
MIKRNVLRGGCVAILQASVCDRSRRKMKFAGERINSIGRCPAGLRQPTNGERRIFRWGRFECGSEG